MSAKNDLEPVNLDRQTDRHDYIHTSRCILLFLGLGREIIPGKRPWRGELWGRRRTAAMRIDSPSYFLLPLPFDLLLLGTRYLQKNRTKKNLENTGIRARFGGTFGRWNGQNQGFGIGNRNALWVRDDRTSRRLSLFSLSLLAGVKQGILGSETERSEEPRQTNARVQTWTAEVVCTLYLVLRLWVRVRVE